MGNSTDTNSKEVLESWYQRFVERIPVSTSTLRVTTSFGEGNVLLAGDASNPPLVCLHAMLTSSAHVVSELGPLLNHFRVIAPDLPAQSFNGPSTKLSYKDDSIVRWLEETLDELQLDEVYLMGVSIGGLFARKFVESRSDRVKKLVLLVPAGIVQAPVLKELKNMFIPILMYKIFKSEKWLRKLAEPILTTKDDDWMQYFGDAMIHMDMDMRIPPLATDEQLQHVLVPTFIMAAENDISFPGEALIQRVESHIPDLRTALIENSRHCPPTTDAFRNWMANQVLDFIAPAEE